MAAPEMATPAPAGKDPSKGMLAINIDVRLRNWVNTIANLQGKTQSEVIEGIIAKEARSFDTAALVKQMTMGL
jgi:hypothetical protein